MSREYSTKKIKEALDATNSHAGQTRQVITAQAMEDPKLLKELVKPHMVGIIAHAVNRVMNGKEEDQSDLEPQMDDKDDSFGLDILKTIAGGDTTQFGHEAYSRPLKKQGVSKSHIDAIQQMIKNQNKD